MEANPSLPVNRNVKFLAPKNAAEETNAAQIDAIDNFKNK